MWATPECPKRCPVIIFEHFIQERSESMCKPMSLFYLAMNWNNWTTIGSKWYKIMILPLFWVNVYIIDKIMGMLKGCPPSFGWFN